MFVRKPTKEDIKLDDIVDDVLDAMDATGPDSTEKFAEHLSQLERLNAVRHQKRRIRVSPDTIVTTVGTLLGILTIVVYEQKHVLVSKGLGFVPKQK